MPTTFCQTCNGYAPLGLRRSHPKTPHVEHSRPGHSYYVLAHTWKSFFVQISINTPGLNEELSSVVATLPQTCKQLSFVTIRRPTGVTPPQRLPNIIQSVAQLPSLARLAVVVVCGITIENMALMAAVSRTPGAVGG